MTYRERLDLYKQGRLEEEERKEVAAEIEKQDAISEYLFQESPIPEFEELEETSNREATATEDAGEEKQFLKLVQQSIRRAFVKMGIAVGTVVLTVVLFVVFALPHIVSLFYYNPGEIVGKDGEHQTNQLSLDMAVYTELFVPGYYRDNVSVEDCGYGKYDICINQTTSLTGIFTNLGGVMNQNRMMLYDVNVIKKPVQNVFVRTEDTPYYTTMEFNEGEQTVYIGAAGRAEEAKAALKELDDKDYYVAYVTLEHLMNYEEFMEWFDQIPIGWGELWCSAYAQDEGQTPLAYNVGFRPYPNGCVLEYDQEKYPYLSLLGEDGQIPETEETMQTHLISMLEYMSRQETFLQIMGEDATDYPAVIEAVKRDGLRLNGFAVVARKKDILTLSEEKNVCYIYTVPMR